MNSLDTDPFDFLFVTMILIERDILELNNQLVKALWWTNYVKVTSNLAWYFCTE